MAYSNFLNGQPLRDRTRVFASVAGPAFAGLLSFIAIPSNTFAQSTAAPPTNASTPLAETPSPNNVLATDQNQVAQRFRKLEDLLLRSAELESANNPARAALLQQAAQLGKQAHLAELLARAGKSLEQKQFSQAIEDQKTSRESLKRLLELLQSENRQDRIREQRDEVRRWIEETDRLLRLQISQRGRTEGGQETQQAAKDQGKLADKASDIANELKSGDEKELSKGSESGNQSNKNAKPSDQPSKENPSDAKKQDESKSTEGKPNEKKSTEPSENSQKQSGGKKSDSSPADGKQNDSNQSDGKQSDGKQSDGKQSDSKQSDGKQSDGQKSDGKQKQDSKQGDSNEQSQDGSNQQSQQPNQPQDPTQRAKQRLENAQQKMKEAQKQLEEAQRKGAVEKQMQAEEELRAAIEELEEILRQLREEEIERSLAALETRLKRMLELQITVLDETKRLQEISGEQANRQIEIKATTLAQDERKILVEGQRAQLLLRDEGSSVAFPEAIAQVVTDVENVAGRLGRADVGKLTVAIEQEIVTALEEMVTALAAVQKEQKERKEREQQQQQQPQGEPGEQPLVNKLAELRLIKTLQVRVNNRTNTLSAMLRDPNDPVGQAEAEEILHQVRELAQRQAKIHRVARDIDVGKAQ